MAKKPTYEELEQWVKALKKEAIKGKRAEEALRKSEERYRSVVDDQTELICRFTPDCTLSFVNLAYARYWNKTPDKLIGTNFLILIPESARRASVEHFASFSPQEPVKMIEHEVLAPNEIICWQQWINHAFFDEKGNIVEFQSVGRDITDRKQEEVALRESEGRYRSLFKNNHSVMLVIDPKNGDIVDANPAAVSYYGWSHDVLTTKKITDINMLTEEQVFQEMEKAKSEQRRHFFFQHRLSNGDIRDVEVYSGPIKLHGQNLLYSIIHDITDRKQAEEALREANTALKVLLKRRGEDQTETEEKILANVNELITPLIDSLKQTKLDERQSTWLEILETNLRNIVSPFSRDLHAKYWRLTTMEFQVANYIRVGKSTKEIAKLLSIAPSTVNTYRDNIRMKLGIKNKKINLKTYLFDLD